MKRILATLGVATFIVGGNLLPAAATTVDTRPYVTLAEFRHANYGERKTPVHDMFDTRGERVWISYGSDTDELRE
jgi:hypothetical protein